MLCNPLVAAVDCPGVLPVLAFILVCQLLCVLCQCFSLCQVFHCLSSVLSCPDNHSAMKRSGLGLYSTVILY